MNVERVFKFLSSPILWTLVIISLALFFGRRVVDWMRVNWFRSDAEKSQDGFDPLDVDKFRLPKPEHFYTDAAERLHSAMYGLGTKETEVFALLEGLNVDELKRVYNQFGHRVLGDTDWRKLVGKAPKKDLVGWLQEEFSGDDLERLRAIWLPTGLWK